MKRKPRPLTYWQKLWLLSVVNGTKNHQELLPNNGWKFPSNTWFQKKLEDKRRGRETR